MIDYGGSDNESSIRNAFERCLDAYCRDHREKLRLVPEIKTGAGIFPDGTVKDTLRMARGYWEAKDTHDVLDVEIQKKFNRGYPRDNIIFEDSQTAVLFQNRQEAMRVDMTRPGELHRLIRRFLDYELPQIEEFRHAQQQFKTDLPAVLDNLRLAVDAAQADNAAYQTAAQTFLEQCQQTISPDITATDVREMLLQHILTKDIFLRVFAEDQFHHENNIARHLDDLEQTFFTGDVRREAVDRLRAYYGAIGRAADEIADYAEKQHFIKAVYEDFYKAYNPAAADRLGVVYTPNEVVDFIIRGADHLLQKHFGRTLADDNVQILDPATGTGTFITNLINYLPADRLEYKYDHEIHANEVAILPYYIANLNIEYTYKERTGHYREFRGLCFVDTLDNMAWTGATGGAVERQGAFELGAMSEENWLRVQEQNDKDISVIIGNPPYNANQQNENDNNKNREYPEIDRRISETYIAASTAQKTKQYDMYKRFIRWASDRLDDDGIVGFVSNSAFLDARQDDGFRKVVAQEFNELWVVDLKGNARTSGERRRQEGGNVFDDKIRVGVAIYFLVRRKESSGFRVFYNAIGDYVRAGDKIVYIKDKPFDELAFYEITPDAKNNWLNQSNSDFEQLIPVADRQTKLAKTAADEQAVFRLYSLGVVTARDEWVHDWDQAGLTDKVLGFINRYERMRALYGGQDVDDDTLGTSIKWTRDLKRQLRSDSANSYSKDAMRASMYRPFIEKLLYFDQNLNEMQYQLPLLFPDGSKAINKVICISGTSSSKPFHTLAVDRVYSYDFLEKTQCLPLYRYASDGERVSNITEWGLRQFREHYGDDTISPEDIFAYTYAVLHDPPYREKYAIDLLREFPRLPFYQDFPAWVEMGQRLLDLHIGFESAQPYGLNREDLDGDAKRVILRADKEAGVIRLDDQTRLTGVPESAWRYRLGSRSALEWILDQYKERKPRDPTIAAKFNTYRFADYKERVIDLLQRVCTVSVETMHIVDGMAYWDGNQLVISNDRETNELAELSASQWFDEPEDPEWEAAWSET